MLQFATKYSSPECVDELLCSQFKVVEVDFKETKFGQTAMHMACKDDKLEIVKLLLAKNAGWLLLLAKSGHYKVTPYFM